MPPYPGPPHPDESAVWSPPFIHNARPNFSTAIQNGQRAPNVLVRHHDQGHNPDRRVHSQPTAAWPTANPHELSTHRANEDFLRSVQSLYDDPAFSTDPRHHPDFVMTSREQIVSAPPPTHAVPKPPVSLGSPAFTFSEPFEAETSFPNKPFPSPPLPTPPYPPPAFVDQRYSFGPTVATAEPPASSQRLGPPPKQPRAISDPLPAGAVVERPQLERKGNSSPPLRRPPDLDKIDELDETDPLGVPWHHGGRYEVLGNPTPSPDQFPSDAPQPTSVYTIQGPAGKKEKKVKSLKMEEPMLNLPPAPVPYSLNLKPGQVLRTQTNMEIPRYGSNRALAPVTAFPHTNFEPFTTPSVSRTLHDNGGPASFELTDPFRQRTPFNQGPQALPHRRNLSLPPPYTDSTMLVEYHDRNTPAASPTDNLVDQPLHDEHMINQRPSRPQVRFSTPASSIQTGSDSSSSVTRSRREMPKGPQRPKQLVMPTPLQPLQPSSLPAGAQAPKSSAHHDFVPPRASHIPIHESKMKNLLKKRASTGKTVQKGNEGQNLSRAATIGGFPITVGGVPEQEKERKAPRRLSKRKI